MELEYPERTQFFAHRFVRLLHKAAVAAEIGRDAFSLLVVIAHTEDAMRYRGAAKFWNSQLIETLGFSKWDQFDKARRKAVESGWLRYSGDGKRTAGEYFVVIPEGYDQITDSPIEHCTVVNPENGYDRGYKEGYEQGIIEGIKRVQSGVQSGYEQGEPSIPIPFPNPIYSPGEEIQIPRKMQTPEVMTTVAQWFRHLEMKSKQEKIPPRNSPQEQAWWQVVSRMGPDGFVAAAQKAMAEGWVTFRDSKANGSEATAEHAEWIEALKAAQQYGSDWQKRRAVLGGELFEALKRTGTAKVAESDSFNQKTLREVFYSHLKDIRSGITTSN